MSIACVQAQPLQASLTFLSDTVSVGGIIQARLIISHPDTLAVFFPQSPADFFPFELKDKSLRPTHTLNHRSIDTVLYQLQTFELAPKQALSLPYRFLSKNDTLTRFVNSDSIELQFRIKTTDSLSQLTYKPTKGLILLQDPPNLILISILVAIGLFGVFFVIISLRRPIARYLRRQLIKQEWNGIKRQLSRVLSLKNNQAKYMEELNKVWKDVFEKELKTPLRSLTTTELIPTLQSSEALPDAHKSLLIHAAQIGDKTIYAGIPASKEEMDSLTKGIEDVLSAVYENKLKRI